MLSQITVEGNIMQSQWIGSPSSGCEIHKWIVFKQCRVLANSVGWCFPSHGKDIEVNTARVKSLEVLFEWKHSVVKW